jgi:phytanoyl-CoA hydroxylase
MDTESSLLACTAFAAATTLFLRKRKETYGKSDKLKKNSQKSNFLSLEQIEFFNSNGYLVLDDFLTRGTVAQGRERMEELLSEFDFGDPEAAVFSTNDQTRKSDEYFLGSGDKIRFFWEEKAWVDGKLTKNPRLAVNKVGHALHDLDPIFKNISYDPRVFQTALDLGLDDPMAVQSMYIFKQARIGGEVGAHQDGTFLYTRPQSVLGLWWAFDDCTTKNGCLWAVPGSHKDGVNRRFKRKEAPAVGTEFVPPSPEKWDLSQAIPLETFAGSLVLLHHALVHYSAENTSDKARHAYSIHVVDGAPGVEYPVDNWLQRLNPSIPFFKMKDINL